MGVRKKQRAEQYKEAKRTKYYARLRNCPTSPRKMRLVADMIRNMRVNQAIDVLRNCPKEAARRLEKLLLSAISNWEQKNEDNRIEESDLYIKEIFVDQARTLKRLRPAPQGRAHRIRKRSNHVTIVLDSFSEYDDDEDIEELEELDDE